MNYHVEHHMFPNVPFYALPALHEAIKADCPPAYPSLWAAYIEMVPAVRAQQYDVNHYIRRPLPSGANPTPDTNAYKSRLCEEPMSNWTNDCKTDDID